MRLMLLSCLFAVAVAIIALVIADLRRPASLGDPPATDQARARFAELLTHAKAARHRLWQQYERNAKAHEAKHGWSYDYDEDALLDPSKPIPADPNAPKGAAQPITLSLGEKAFGASLENRALVALRQERRFDQVSVATTLGTVLVLSGEVATEMDKWDARSVIFLNIQGKAPSGILNHIWSHEFRDAQIAGVADTLKGVMPGSYDAAGTPQSPYINPAGRERAIKGGTP